MAAKQFLYKSEVVFRNALSSLDDGLTATVTLMAGSAQARTQTHSSLHSGSHHHRRPRSLQA
jgi:hypothetical protein